MPVVLHSKVVFTFCLSLRPKFAFDGWTVDTTTTISKTSKKGSDSWDGYNHLNHHPQHPTTLIQLGLGTISPCLLLPFLFHSIMFLLLMKFGYNGERKHSHTLTFVQ